MAGIENKKGQDILMNVVFAIQDNKDYLGDIDGLIGDGDHGANMNKGFTLFGTRIENSEISLSDGLQELGMILMNEIGGSMGPIYGTIFIGMAETFDESEIVDLANFTRALERGLLDLQDIVEARSGDKTLMDTLVPAVDSLKSSLKNEETFKDALGKMKESAEHGKESTKDLVAKFGRSSRLGERSRGVLDAGACSCNIILRAMADGILEKLQD